MYSYVLNIVIIIVVFIIVIITGVSVIILFIIRLLRYTVGFLFAIAEYHKIL